MQHPWQVARLSHTVANDDNPQLPDGGVKVALCECSAAAEDMENDPGKPKSQQFTVQSLWLISVRVNEVAEVGGQSQALAPELTI